MPGLHRFQTLTWTFSPELSTRVSLVFEVSPASLPSPVNDYPGWRLPKSHQDSNRAGMTSPSKHWLCWPRQGARSQQCLHSFLLTQPRCAGPSHCQLVVCCSGTDQNPRRPQPPPCPCKIKISSQLWVSCDGPSAPTGDAGPCCRTGHGPLHQRSGPWQEITPAGYATQWSTVFVVSEPSSAPRHPAWAWPAAAGSCKLGGAGGCLCGRRSPSSGITIWSDFLVFAFCCGASLAFQRRGPQVKGSQQQAPGVPRAWKR